MTMHDVYAYGVIAPSTLIELRDDYPPAGGYSEIAESYESLGGEAAGSAYVLARLGVSTKLQGNHLADEPPSTRVIQMLTEVGVDCSAIVVDGSVRPVTEVVIAEGTERTVFGTYKSLNADRAWADGSRPDIETSRIVCVDPFFGTQSARVCQWARETDTPYVTVDTAPDSEIAKHAEVLVVSEEYTATTLDISDPRDVLSAYTDQCEGLVVLTRGSDALWYGRRSAPPRTWDPFTVPVRDTTGAGDGFRAGIIYGMLHGYSDEQLVQTAGAVSALVCQAPPGVLHSPTVEALRAFLSSR